MWLTIGSNVGEGKWFSSKLHLNWVAKERYIADPSHVNGRNYWRIGGDFFPSYLWYK